MSNTTEHVKENKKGKIYLSGSISKKENYKEDFDAFEKIFLDNGFEVVNPSSFDSTKEYSEIMKRDLTLLLECNFIFFVNDITTSKGAFLEKIVAQECGISELRLTKEGDQE